MLATKKQIAYLQSLADRAQFIKMRPNSLILSARDKDGNPIETIEVDLLSFKILQCYGKGDTFTPLHKEIIKTMNKNMWQVKQLRRAS